MDMAARKNELIQQYFEMVLIKEELMAKFQEGGLSLEETGQLVKVNTDQYQLVTEMINLQLIQIHISEEDGRFKSDQTMNQALMVSAFFMRLKNVRDLFTILFQCRIMVQDITSNNSCFAYCS